VSVIWRYFIYSVLVGRCSRSLNSPLLLIIQGLFKSIFTIVLFKGPKETRYVSTFLTFQIFWIFLCRFPYLEVHYSENCSLHCHQQSAPSSFFPQISAYLIAIFSFKKWSLLYLEACSMPNHQHSKLILVGSRHLQPQENIYIQRNNCQESPNGGKITIFFLELGPQTLLLVSENIFSQNIFLPRT